MKCAWYQRWLTASADEELAGWRAALLRRHLAGCTRCAAELAELRRIRELVAGQKAHYVGKLDDTFFWQQLRARLQTPQQPEPEPDGELVMAYSCRQKKEPCEPAGGVAFWGVFPTHCLAWSALAVALLVAALIGVLGARAFQERQLVCDLPLVPPSGQSCVQVTEIKSTEGTRASVVKFDQPDVDIVVIKIDGLPPMGKELKPASGEL